MTAAPRERTLRVVTYNILLGGYGREERIAGVLERADADVVALQEASDLGLVRRLARRLQMHVRVGASSDGSELNVVVMSRRPILHARNRRHPGLMLRSHLECDIETAQRRTPSVRIHCVHLAARFGERANGEVRRMREIGCVLGAIERSHAQPHLLVGDFNAVAPGDEVAATRFFRRMAELRRAGVVVRTAGGMTGPLPRAHPDDESNDEVWLRAGVDPRLDVGVPRLPWMVGPITERLPRMQGLDRLLNRMIERWTVTHLLDSGYTDSFRAVHRYAHGYTCATWMPAARIDYMFADEAMASRLQHCDVIGQGDRHDPQVAGASDHFPVVADFAL